MTKPTISDYNVIDQVSELLNAEGFDGLGKMAELLINTAMRLERERYLHAGLYERTPDRVSHANGFKPKSLKTRIGKLQLSVPQTRDGQFYPASLEKGMRSERALKLALAEMYVQGVSTRKVAKITEELCGFGITSDQVSKCAKALDESLETWRNTPLSTSYRYLILDARYEKVRTDGVVVDAAVLIAKAVRADGSREIIGVSVSLSEAEVHWREFLQSLVRRGLHGIELIISDAHSGLRGARKNVFPSVPWQRCQFHLQQNAQSYVNKLAEREKVGEAIRNIFNAPSLVESQRLLSLAVEKYEGSNSKLAAWMEESLPEGLTIFMLDNSKHRKKLRTTNTLERVNREIKRRTRVASIFPNPSSCLRLVSALLMEQSETWLTEEKRYLCFDD